MHPKRGSSSDQLPSVIYLALIGFVAWMALAAWGFAGRAPPDAPEDRARFSDWAAGEFETWQDSVKGTNAAAEIILPIAAAAVGMTAFAIVFHYAAQHASG